MLVAGENEGGGQVPGNESHRDVAEGIGIKRFGFQAVVNLTVHPAGAQQARAFGHDPFAQFGRQSRVGYRGNNVIGLLLSDFCQVTLLVFGRVFGHDQARIADAAHVLAQVVIDLESDDFTVGVQPFQDVLGDNAVAGTEFHDGPRPPEINGFNGRPTEGRGGARNGAGSADALNSGAKKRQGTHVVAVSDPRRYGFNE